MPNNSTFDVIIAGAGIVGLATAYEVRRAHPTATVLVVEKEAAVGQHQTGHNSGVIHSGLYYKPGSLKAETCTVGRRRLIDFCDQHGVAYDLCGKVVVAMDAAEQTRLETLAERGTANGVNFTRLSSNQLRNIEPHCAGTAALHVHDTGIVDYPAVANRLADMAAASGELSLNTRVTRVRETNAGVDVDTPGRGFQGRIFVNCAGLQCDRVMTSAGVKPPAEIVPFRGEYYELRPEARSLCRHLIYPVPDPSFPFLGVHVTRMIDGRVECGPNAVLAFAREGYSFGRLSVTDLASTLLNTGFRKLARRHLSMGLAEMKRSLSKHAFAEAVRRLVPDLKDDDLVPAPAGVRAQAVLPDGSLVDDFLIHETERMVHVNNAPSPAATASLEIGRQIAARAVAKL